MQISIPVIRIQMMIVIFLAIFFAAPRTCALFSLMIEMVH